MSTKIEWTEMTWSPVTGCSKTSPGCDSCYAIGQARRHDRPGTAYEGTTVRVEIGGRTFTDWSGRVNTHPSRLGIPFRWSTPKRIFVCSMADLFHADVTDGFIGSTWNTMALTPQHTYQVLTKRSERMRRLLSIWYAAGSFRDHRMRFVEPATLPLPNVHVGVSIESDRYTFRADHLRATPAAVRWISAEPLLGPLPSLDLTGIDWLVVGAESGSGARPMDLGWVRDLRDRCSESGTAFFVKQLSGGFRAVKDIELFPPDLRIREYPTQEVAA